MDGGTQDDEAWGTICQQWDLSSSGPGQARNEVGTQYAEEDSTQNDEHAIVSSNEVSPHNDDHKTKRRKKKQMKNKKTKNAVHPGAARAKSSGGSCQFASSVPFVERESITVTVVTPPVPSEEKGCDAAVFDAFDEIVRKMERLEDLADMLDEEVATDWCLYADTDGRPLRADGCFNCFNCDGTESGCTHEEMKKQDERKAEQRDEQYDNSSESSNDDGHAPCGIYEKAKP